MKISKHNKWNFPDEPTIWDKIENVLFWTVGISVVVIEVYCIAVLILTYHKY